MQPCRRLKPSRRELLAAESRKRPRRSRSLSRSLSPAVRRKIPEKFVSTFHSRPSFLRGRTLSCRGRHLADDRRGSAGAFRSLPPSPAMRPVIAEITRWKSIGDALAPTDRATLPLASRDISFSKRGSDPTVRPPVSRQGRRGACVSYGTFPEIAGKAHCCSGAPPLPPRLYHRRSLGSGRGAGGGGGCCP